MKGRRIREHVVHPVVSGTQVVIVMLVVGAVKLQRVRVESLLKLQENADPACAQLGWGDQMHAGRCHTKAAEKSVPHVCEHRAKRK
jgi:hypothetical protein